MSIKRYSSGPHPSCAEHCDDYLLLLHELLEAEVSIEKLQQEIEALRDLLEHTPSAR